MSIIDKTVCTQREKKMPGLSEELSRFVVSPPQLICREGEPDKMYCSFILTTDFSGFRGHFPDNPLLPGIVQIMLARYTAAAGKSAQLAGVKRCKFLHPIKPGETVSVAVKPGRHTGEYQAVISSNEIDCTSLVFELEHTEAWQ
ncbi:hypothetical protein OMR58_20460 [Erwinia sp. INIA-01]|uniref:hypothetical protein n=1 Tax=Erwinia sp. INIA01 TaxID=2991500 RepID=UPI0022256D6C|nr:hypothetical protein [Erwinia sp. INIA01]MCW1876824.1 hypothetical protein [Erwinia sp. INIA01]